MACLRVRGGCEDFDHEAILAHAAALEPARKFNLMVTSGVAKLMHKNVSCANSLAVILRLRNQRIVFHRIPVYNSHCVLFPMLPEHTAALQPCASLECVTSQCEAMHKPHEYVQYIERSHLTPRSPYRHLDAEALYKQFGILSEDDLVDYDDDSDDAAASKEDPERRRVKIGPLRVFANPGGGLTCIHAGAQARTRLNSCSSLPAVAAPCWPHIRRALCSLRSSALTSPALEPSCVQASSRSRSTPSQRPPPCRVC